MANVKLNFMHVCENAFLSDDNKLNIIGIFNKIITKKIPSIHPKLYIVTNVSGSPSNYIEAIEIVSPEERVIVHAETRIEIKENENANFIAQFVGTPFEKEGRYKIRVLIDGSIINDENYILLRQK